MHRVTARDSARDQQDLPVKKKTYAEELYERALAIKKEKTENTTQFSGKTSDMEGASDHMTQKMTSKF